MKLPRTCWEQMSAVIKITSQKHSGSDILSPGSKAFSNGITTFLFKSVQTHVLLKPGATFMEKKLSHNNEDDLHIDHR